MPVAFSTAVELMENTPAGNAVMPAITVAGTNVALVLWIHTNGTTYSSVSDTAGSTWVLRARTDAGSTFYLEEWAALLSTGVSGNVVTAVPTGSPFFRAMILAGFTGVTGFDAAGPGISTAAGQISISPQATSFMAIAGYRFSTFLPTAGATFTGIGSSNNTNYTLAEYKSFSTAQASVLMDVGTGANTENGGIVDVLIGPVSSVTTTLFPNSMIVSWVNAGVGDTPIDNHVRYRATLQPTFLDNNRPYTTGTSQPLSGLSANTSYDIVVQAHNAAGDAFSNTFVILTAPMPAGATAVLDGRIQNPATTFLDASGVTWNITSGAQCAYNSTVDLSTASVDQMALTNSGTLIWQRNTSLNWYNKAATASPVQDGWTGPVAAPF